MPRPPRAVAALGAAVNSVLEAATPYSTGELSLSFVRPVSEETGILNGRASIAHAGRTLAESDIEIRDPIGRLIARGGCRCILSPPISVPPDMAASVRASPPAPVEPTRSNGD